MSRFSVKATGITAFNGDNNVIFGVINPSGRKCSSSRSGPSSRSRYIIKYKI